MGDAVLGYVASVHLFRELGTFHESVLSEGRVRIVCNEVLVRRAKVSCWIAGSSGSFAVRGIPLERVDAEYGGAGAQGNHTLLDTM